MTREEFARILLHLSQRRGFKSNRKNPDAKSEDGALLTAVNENRNRMVRCGYRTVGEMLCKDAAFALTKRNKGGAYLTTVSRDMIAEEVRAIFAAQRALQMPFAAESVENAYLDILLSQRSFDDGPASGPYAGGWRDKVGLCTFERAAQERRAAKATYSFEYFALLEKINHIRIHSGGESLPLTAQQRTLLIEEAHKKENLTFAAIRKLLGLTEQQSFNCVRYEKDTAPADCETKTKLSQLRAYHKMRAALDKVVKGRITQLSVEQRNCIGTALTFYHTSDKLRPVLAECGLTEADMDALETITGFSGFGHLSVKACDKLIPHLEQGMNYNDACVAAGYEFKAHDGAERTRLLNAQSELLDDLTSPVVRRSIAQTIKVVNAIIRRQGDSPTFVNIEVARDLARDLKERRKAEKDMEQNRARNERIRQQIRTTFGIDSPTGQDIVKMKLYEEQCGVCPYSGKQMSLERIFTDPHYAEVDHILPYSISFDDSYKNKVLVLSAENRNKGNRLPLQYLTGQRRSDFIVWVNASIHDYRKRQNLLKEAFTAEDEARFKERNLQDTRTASRFLYNYINDTLLFAPSERKRRVTAVNGAITSYLRKRWGISKLRENGDLHHAVDALVVVCATNGMIQQISRHAQFRECEYQQQEDGSYIIDRATGEVLRRFPYPWPDFRRELEARLGSNPTQAVLNLRLPAYIDSGEPICLRRPFVSRVPRRKVTGAAHKDTVKGKREAENGYAIVKRPLTALKLDKNGEIDGYYDPSSDRKLYEALRARLHKFGGNAEKAFAQPFYKPTADGKPAPIVKKVKLLEKTTLHVAVQQGNGIADHDTMVRIDVFYVENDGYYFVPVYVADTLSPTLPNKACVAHKPYAEWKEMRDEDFLFSLYPNDLIRVEHKKGFKLTIQHKESTLPPSLDTKTAFFYYNSANISSGAITGVTHDDTYSSTIGLKTLYKIEKYTVDVLGEYHPVKKEPRQPFVRKRGK